MKLSYQIIVAPLVGALIGYVTNDIAIKMLFRPRKAIYIGKFKVPFTPGLIPKEKDRVAKSIGNVISTQLLNSDVIAKTLTSEEMIVKLREGLEKLIEENHNNNDTIEEALLKVTERDVVDTIIFDVKSDVASMIHEKLTSFEFGENISKSVLHGIKQKIDSTFFSVVAVFIDDNLINNLSKNIGQLINKTIADNSEEITKNLIGNEIDKAQNLKICDIIARYDNKMPNAIDFIIQSYKSIIENNLPQMLNTINISKVVEDRVSSFDVIELENMIFDIMKKELNAIVYLGALLGFIMGFINIFIRF